MIPAGWRELRLGDFCDVVMGQSPESRFYNRSGEGLPLIQGNADIANRRTIERVWSVHSPKEASEGDVLLTVRAPVGAVARASTRVCLGRGVCAVRARDVSPSFIFHALVFGEPRWSALEQGSTFTAANSRDVADFVISVPETESEQTAIAEVLSDADALVESLDALIAKKRDMKQAAMQQLLTGRTRFPGFTDEWHEVRLGDIAILSAAPAKKSGGSQYVIVDMGSVAKDGSLLTHKRTDDSQDMLQMGDLVMPKDDIGGGQIIGKAVLIVQPNQFVLGDHAYRLRLSAGRPPYVRYAINSHHVNTSLRSKVVGSAQLGLGRRSVLEQEIPFPPFDEQQAIAEVLSDLDAEIDALVAQREKAELVKQGMMQELLSGRVRLV